MSTPKETYKLLSDGVEEMRVGHQAAKKRAEAREKGPLPARAAGRIEYIQTLQQLQANAQLILERTSDEDEKEMLATQFGARKPRHSV